MSARRTFQHDAWAVYAAHHLRNKYGGRENVYDGTVATWHGYVRVFAYCDPIFDHAIFHFVWRGRHHRLVVRGGPPLTDRGLVRIARRFAREVAAGTGRT